MLSKLKGLFEKCEEAEEKGNAVFGKGVLKLFDFVNDSLPANQLKNIRHYNRRSFVLFDSYMVLRDIKQELTENSHSLLLGLSGNGELKKLILKGAEKAHDDNYVKFK